MEDILKDFKENWFLDETNTGIAKEHYKEEGFKQIILFKIKRNELDEKYFEECLNTIKPLLNNENLIICLSPIVRYQTNSYAVDDITDIESIKNSIKNGFIVLLYAPIIIDGELKYKTRILHQFIKMNRIEEIKKRVDKSDNLLLIDKHELESLKKITKTTKISDYEVLTDEGFVEIEALHETIPYEVYELKLADGKTLKCADNHIVFVTEYHETTFEPIGLTEVFVKELQIGSFVMVSDDNGNLTESEVIEVTNLGYEEVMYDLELKEGSNRRYFTNGILSHNTMLAKLLAENVYGDVDSLIRIDMSEYMEKISVSRLVGAPPGYVGYEQGGQLTEKVRRKPHCVILFDEIEKAHEDVFNILLQLLDEGQLTDGLGRKINFKNALIILTSNIGVSELNAFGKGLGFQTNLSIANEEARVKSILEKALKSKFKPEFLNRIDETIIFRTLTPEDIQKIVHLEIKKLETRLKENGFGLKISKEAIEFLGKEGYDPIYGARPLARTIQHYIEDAIADEILSEKLSERDIFNIDFDSGTNEIKIKVKTKK
jgi:hypothetical protein